MTSVTECQRRLNGNTSIFARMGIMTGTAGLLLKRWMDSFFDRKKHVAVAFHAELSWLGIQQILIWRCMGFMAGGTLFFIYRRMYVCLGELLFFLLFAGGTLF